LSLLRPAHCVLSFRRPLSLIKPSVAARPAAETQRVRVALCVAVCAVKYRPTQGYCQLALGRTHPLMHACNHSVSAH
jgi:hypothetical protein